MQKMTKFLDWINRGENSEKGFEKLTVRISIGRKLDSIDQKNSFDQSSINRALIEPGKLKPKLLSHFRLVEQLLRSVKNMENSIF